MIHAGEIWVCIKEKLKKGQWLSLEIIYKLIEKNHSLDEEDFQPESPSSSSPKWKRNVRSVLQRRKKKGEIEWDGNANYKIN